MDDWTNVQCLIYCSIKCANNGWDSLTTNLIYRIDLTDYFLILFSDRLKIEGSNILNMDISATNGVIQVLENVIELDEKKLVEEYENNILWNGL